MATTEAGARQAALLLLDEYVLRTRGLRPTIRGTA